MVILSPVADKRRFLLVDGYLTVEALRRCGKDMVLAEVWICEGVGGPVSTSDASAGAALTV
jgi:hypothetical protein